jgi:hypothetical protein
MNISKVKILFLLGNLLPFFQLLIFVIALLQLHTPFGVMTFLILYIYLLPPLLFRALHLFYTFVPGGYRLSDSELLIWWYGAQLQLLFARLPFLEELLRILPFVYSAWLRLWGAKIGKLVYWSPRIEILDRNLIEIGDRTVVGYGAKFSSHLINKEKIFLAKISIGADALIGGDTKIAPGCEIADHAIVPALSVLMPMTKFKSDVKNTSAEK